MSILGLRLAVLFLRAKIKDTGSLKTCSAMTCLFSTIAMCGFLLWTAATLYRCSSLPFQKQVEDYVISLAIAVSCTSTIATVLNVSLKWIEVANKEMKWITKKQMLKSSQIVVFIEISFVMTSILCITIAKSYNATVILSAIMCVLITASLWKGATMVCRKLEIQQVRKLPRIQNRNAAAHTLEQKCENVFVESVACASTSKLPRLGIARPKLSRLDIQKIHPGPGSTSRKLSADEEIIRVSFPASAGALAIMRTAKTITRCCCAYVSCASMYALLQASLRFKVVVALIVVAICFLGMFVHFIILHYIAYSKSLSFRSAHKFSTEALQKLKQAGKMLQRVTTIGRRRCIDS